MKRNEFFKHKLWIASALIILIVLAFFSTAGAAHPPASAEAQSGPAIDIPVVESEHPYANNFNDFWTIEIPGAEATRIHFSRIELEENADYLIISDPSDKRTQVITGNYPDGLWTDPVPGSYVRVRLITDVNVRKWGFAIDQAEAMAYPSTHRSAHPYHNNTNETWTVLNDDPTPGEATRIHFSKIDLEENVDWLILSDIDGNPFQYITGSHPDGLWSIGVPGIAVKVRLLTDSDVEQWGFDIDGTESAVSDAPVPLPNFQTIVQSNHPYADGENTTWTIVNPDPGATTSKVHFSRIELGPYDYLDIFDAEDNRIQLWTGSTDLYDVWSDYVPGRIVKIRLRETSSHGGYWGFRIDRITQGENLKVFAQSNHPYADGENTTWTIVNPDPGATTSKVHFSRIELGPYDYLDIFDAEDNRIQLWTGSTDLYDVWSDYVPGRIVKIRLRETSSHAGYWGFRIDRIMQSENLKVFAQSNHPYADGENTTWTIVNPNPSAQSTKIHFDRIQLGPYDYLDIFDAEDNRIQLWTGSTDLYDVWSDYVPGRIVKIRLRETSSHGGYWGFRIDDIYPANEDPITPAGINGIYVQVNHPGHIFLNDTEVAYAQIPGEYKVPLSGIGEHHIYIEYMDYTQDILVTVTERGGIHVIYLPVQEKE